MNKYRLIFDTYKAYTTSLEQKCSDNNCIGPSFIGGIGNCKHIPYSRELYYEEITAIQNKFPNMSIEDAMKLLITKDTVTVVYKVPNMDNISKEQEWNLP